MAFSNINQESGAVNGPDYSWMEKYSTRFEQASEDEKEGLAERREEKAHWAKARAVKRDDRDTGIAPGAIIQAPEDRRRTRSTRSMFQPLARLQFDSNTQKQLYLPGFGAGEAHGDPLSPALPLTLYHLGVGQVERKTSKAAPLALRIFVEACLSVPQSVREEGPVLLPPQRLGDFLYCLFPTGPKGWQPERRLEQLLRACEALESPQARIPWRDPETGRGSSRRVVIPRDVPYSGHMDDTIQFGVDMPPGTKRGPLIDRPKLIQAGVSSAARYRLALNLSFHWCQPGVLQVPEYFESKYDRKTRRPLKHSRLDKLWRQESDPEKYPEVSEPALLSMAFPGENASTLAYRRKRLQQAREALAWLREIGFAAVSDSRIYPGPKWLGW